MCCRTFFRPFRGSLARRNPNPGLGRCEKFGWRRPLRSAQGAITPQNAHLKVCASPAIPIFHTFLRPGLNSAAPDGAEVAKSGDSGCFF